MGSLSALFVLLTLLPLSASAKTCTDCHADSAKKSWALSQHGGIASQAAELRARTGKARADPRPLWLEGEYTAHNRDHN